MSKVLSETIHEGVFYLLVEVKKYEQQSKVPAAALPLSLGRPNYRRSSSVILSPEGGPAKFGMNRSASLNRDTKFSHSGRF